MERLPHGTNATRNVNHQKLPTKASAWLHCRSISSVTPAIMQRLTGSILARLAIVAAMLTAAIGTNAASLETDAELKRIEATLNRLQQAQQSTYQQFQMVQEIQRSELARTDPNALPAAGVAAPPISYEDLQRRRAQREQRLKELQAETERLYARYLALEEEKRALLERLQALSPGR
jgi:hypothetical protein